MKLNRLIRKIRMKKVNIAKSTNLKFKFEFIRKRKEGKRKIELIVLNYKGKT